MCEVMAPASDKQHTGLERATESRSVGASTAAQAPQPRPASTPGLAAACRNLTTGPGTSLRDLIAQKHNNKAGQAVPEASRLGPDSQAAARTHQQQQQPASATTSELTTQAVAAATAAIINAAQQQAAAAASVQPAAMGLPVAATHLAVPADFSQNPAGQVTAAAAAAAAATQRNAASKPAASQHPPAPVPAPAAASAAAAAAIAARAAAISAASTGAPLPWNFQRKVFKLPPATLAPGGAAATQAAHRAWKEYKTADGEVYYFNSVTKQRCWTLPEGAVVQPIQQQEQETEAVQKLKEVAKQQQKGMELLLQQQLQQQGWSIQQQQEGQQQQQQQPAKWNVQQLQQLRKLAEPQLRTAARCSSSSVGRAADRLDGASSNSNKQGPASNAVADTQQMVTAATAGAATIVTKVATDAAPAAAASPAAAKQLKGDLVPTSAPAAIAPPAAAAANPSTAAAVTRVRSLQPPAAAGTPGWVDGLNLKASTVAEATNSPTGVTTSEDRNTLVFVPESKALNYLSKVALHFNAAAGTTACTGWLLYSAGVHVLRPRSGGNAHIWWASDNAPVDNKNARPAIRSPAAAGGPTLGDLYATVPAAAAAEAVRCRSAGMAALLLMRQKRNWRQLLGLDTTLSAGTGPSTPGDSPVTNQQNSNAHNSAHQLPPAAAAAAVISINSSHSSDAGSSADTVSEAAAVQIKQEPPGVHTELQSQLNPGKCEVLSEVGCGVSRLHCEVGGDSNPRKRRTSGDSSATMSDTGAVIEAQAKSKPRLAAAAPAPAPAAAAAPKDDLQVDDPMEADAPTTAAAAAGACKAAATPIDREMSAPAAALEAAAGLLMFLSSHGSGSAESDGKQAAAAAAAAAAEVSAPAKPASSPVTRSAHAAAAAAAKLADRAAAAAMPATGNVSPFAKYCPAAAANEHDNAQLAAAAAAAASTAAGKTSAAAAVQPVVSTASALQLPSVLPRAAAAAAAAKNLAPVQSYPPPAAAAALTPSTAAAQTGIPAAVLTPLQLGQFQQAAAVAVAAAQAQHQAQAAAAMQALQVAAAAPSSADAQKQVAHNMLPHMTMGLIQQQQQQQQQPMAAMSLGGALVSSMPAGAAATQVAPALVQQRSITAAQLLQTVDLVANQLAEATSLANMFKSGLETAPVPLALFSHLLNIGDQVTQTLFLSEAQQLTQNLAKGKQALQLLADNPVYATAFESVRGALEQEVGTAAVWLNQRQGYVQQLRSAEMMAKAMVKGLSEALEKTGV